MRFEKGTKVEVWTVKEGLSGSWRCAEIIGSNNHRYTVRYQEEFGKAMVERVPRKLIRPCPPPVDVLRDWAPGDVVEVLHNFSWKMATILKVSRRKHLLVRLLGSTGEFKANRYDVRARICWQNGEWIVIGKVSNRCEESEDLSFRLPSSRNDNNQPRNVVTFVNGRTKADNEFSKTTNIVLETQAVPSKTLKRPLSHIHSEVEAYETRKNKIRLGKKQNFWNPFNAMQQSYLPEKVENVASSRDVLHEISTQHSYIDRINGSSEMIMEREKRNGVVGFSPLVNLVSNDDGSVSSFVASCSVYRNPPDEHGFATGQYEDNDSRSSDAESFCQLRPKEGNSILPAKELLTDEIRRLELHAYRCTIGALYASGPLSWEKELLLTNLRGSLRISNDDHLAEIRSLVSSSICIPNS